MHRHWKNCSENVMMNNADYPPVHKRVEFPASYDRLEMLWERYPQYHEMRTFTTLEALLKEHEPWEEDFADLREEYADNHYR